MISQLIQTIQDIKHLRDLERAGLVSIEMPASNFLLSDRLSAAQKRALEPALASYEKACLLLAGLTDATKIICCCTLSLLIARHLS